VPIIKHNDIAVDPKLRSFISNVLAANGATFGCIDTGYPDRVITRDSLAIWELPDYQSIGIGDSNDPGGEAHADIGVILLGTSGNGRGEGWNYNRILEIFYLSFNDI